MVIARRWFGRSPHVGSGATVTWVTEHGGWARPSSTRTAGSKACDTVGGTESGTKNRTARAIARRIARCWHEWQSLMLTSTLKLASSQISPSWSSIRSLIRSSRIVLKSRDENRDECCDENRFECGFKFKCVFGSRFEDWFKYGFERVFNCGECDLRIKAWEAREIQLEVRIGAKHE